MPYIPPMLREELTQRSPLRPGELTYEIYVLCKKYLGTHFRYDDLAHVLGCMESAKLELYRRIAVPYEDSKIIENGDV